MAANYANVVAAVQIAVNDAKANLFEDLKKFVLEQLDEDSVVAISSMFDEFKKSKMNAVDAPSKVVVKKSKKSKSDEAQTSEEKPAKAKRAPSAYNIFVGEKIKELRAADPTLKAKDAMSQAMALWKEHKAANSTPSTSSTADETNEVESSDA